MSCSTAGEFCHRWPDAHGQDPVFWPRGGPGECPGDDSGQDLHLPGLCAKGCPEIATLFQIISMGGLGLPCWGLRQGASHESLILIQILQV